MVDSKGVWSIAFNGDGSMLASGGLGSTVRLWDVATGKPVGAPLAGHRDNVNSVAFSRDGTTIASGSADATVMLWDANVADWPRRACAIVGGDIESQEWSDNIRELFKGRTLCAKP
jgi:WD40 repeat protein